MLRRPPDALVYYLDANLDGPELVTRLRAGGMACQAHRDHFASDARDETWLPAIAARGWVIVTRDFAIQRRPNERAAWTTAHATVVMILYLNPDGKLRTHFGGARRGAKKK